MVRTAMSVCRKGEIPLRLIIVPISLIILSQYEPSKFLLVQFRISEGSEITSKQNSMSP
jgi:hypothetical protein